MNEERKSKIKEKKSERKPFYINISEIMDYDCTFGVKLYEEWDTYWIIIPRYYFGNDIASWFNTEVGEYYSSILNESNKEIKGIVVLPWCVPSTHGQ